MKKILLGLIFLTTSFSGFASCQIYLLSNNYTFKYHPYPDGSQFAYSMYVMNHFLDGTDEIIAKKDYTITENLENSDLELWSHEHKVLFDTEVGLIDTEQRFFLFDLINGVQYRTIGRHSPLWGAAKQSMASERGAKKLPDCEEIVRDREYIKELHEKAEKAVGVKITNPNRVMRDLYVQALKELGKLSNLGSCADRIQISQENYNEEIYMEDGKIYYQIALKFDLTDSEMKTYIKEQCRSSL